MVHLTILHYILISRFSGADRVIELSWRTMGGGPPGCWTAGAPLMHALTTEGAGRAVLTCRADSDGTVRRGGAQDGGELPGPLHRWAPPWTPAPAAHVHGQNNLKPDPPEITRMAHSLAHIRDVRIWRRTSTVAEASMEWKMHFTVRAPAQPTRKDWHTAPTV